MQQWQQYSSELSVATLSLQFLSFPMLGSCNSSPNLSLLQSLRSFWFYLSEFLTYSFMISLLLNGIWSWGVLLIVSYTCLCLFASKFINRGTEGRECCLISVVVKFFQNFVGKLDIRSTGRLGKAGERVRRRRRRRGTKTILSLTQVTDYGVFCFSFEFLGFYMHNWAILHKNQRRYMWLGSSRVLDPFLPNYLSSRKFPFVLRLITSATVTLLIC